MAISIMNIIHEIRDNNFDNFVHLISDNPELLNAPASASGRTLLHIAARHNNMKVANFLISKGMDVNGADKYGIVPLHVAAENESYDMSTWLLDKGANVDGVDLEQSTPLVGAIINNDFEMVKLLIERGARLDLTFTKNKNNIKDVMSFAKIYNNQEIIDYLEGQGK